jgi:hypothetical protein
MYKKIKHTITEEHFGHPTASQIKKSVEKYKGVNDYHCTHHNEHDYISGKYSMMEVIDHTGKNKLVPAISVADFNNNVNNYFNTLHTKIVNVLNTLGDPSTNISNSETDLFTNIDDLGNMIMPYYDVTFGQGINYAMRSLAVATIQIVSFVGTGADTKDLQNRISGFVGNDFCNLLYRYNNNWLFSTTKASWDQIVTSILAQAKASKNKDTSGITTADNNLNTGLLTLSSLLSTGIINQNPNMFTR